VPRYAATRTALLYLSLAAAGHLFWEAAQLPLYTISRDGTRRDIAVALFHCTGGDALITAASLTLAILTAWLLRWPLFGGRMALAAILLGLGYRSSANGSMYGSVRAGLTARRCPFCRHSAPVSPPSCNGWSCQAWL
jgi:hypothetical protein